MSENIELNKIISYNGNEEEFKRYIESLNKTSKTSIYENQNYDDKSFKGFTRKYNFNRIKYEGFFKNNEYTGKGILYNYYGIKKYEGYFKNGKYDGIGIEYLSNGKRRRKLYYKNGNILEKSYGVLYDDNDKEIYIGLLIKGKPEKGKNLIFYEDNEDRKYIGDFSNFKYNGKGTIFLENKKLYEGIFKNVKYYNGILYYENENKKYEGDFQDNLYNGNGSLFFETNNKIYFKGIFEKGKYIKGKLFDPNGKIIYEGDFKDNFPKEGKTIQLYDFTEFLFYEGSILNYKYEGIGKLYIKKKNKFYEGEFKSGIYERKGIIYKNNIKKYEGEFKNGKYYIGNLYEIDAENNNYLYYKGNFKNNKIFGKGIKFYKNGNIKIVGLFDNINTYEGIYYNPKNKEIFTGRINCEIPVNNNNNIKLYNDNGDMIYKSKKYSEDDKLNLFIKKRRNELSQGEETIAFNIIFVSSGDTPGKTCVINRLKKGIYKMGLLPTIGLNREIIFYEFNNIIYKYIFWDTGWADRFKCLPCKYLQICDIFIYLFDLREYKKFDEDYIKKIRIEGQNCKFIYLVGNKLDVGYENVQKYRSKAKKLIDRGLINKYFEISVWTKEGLDEFFKILKIDCIFPHFNKSKRIKKINKLLNYYNF